MIKVECLTGVREESESTVLEHLFCVTSHSKHQAFAALYGAVAGGQVLSKQRDAHYARLVPVLAGKLRGWSLQRPLSVSMHQQQVARWKDTIPTRVQSRSLGRASQSYREMVIHSNLDRDSMES